jgi:diguanylate cyclase (GGDEF)-like protein/PAS domain S-box-containing protein
MQIPAKANLSALIESTEDLIWSVDLDDCLITFNSALKQHIESTYGVRLAAGMLPKDIVSPERAELLPALYNRVRAEGSVRVEFPLADGRTLDLALNPIIVDGNVTGISVFGKDITERKAAEKALKEAEKKYQDIFDGALEGFYQTTPEGKSLAANPALAKMLGYDSPDDLLSAVKDTSHDMWVDPDERARFARQLEEQGAIRGYECRFKRKDGTPVWVSLNCRRVCGSDGHTAYFEGFIQDITERKRAEMRLRDSEERYRTVFQTSPDLVDINRLDDGTFIDANDAYLDILGFEREEVIGRTSWELNIWADPGDRQNFVELLRQNSNCRNLEANLRRKNGEIFSVLISAARIELDGVSCVVSVTRDMSAAKAAENTIRSLAFYDPLTGLPNRRLLMERLRKTLASIPRNPRNQALLLVCIDNFKALNETLGHHTGDLLLKEAARRLNTCLGEDGPAARLSGDEFLVILEDLSENVTEASARTQETAEKILASVSQPYLLAGRAVRGTASIGITFFGDRPIAVNDVLQQADIALNQAQTAGRNTIRFFVPALQVAVNARVTLEEDLRQAIKTNQFLLYYQPQVELGRLTGAEALIRWKHPLRGIVPPDQFIPLAEETGLILPMGEWVLNNACTQIASWAGQEQTADFTVAVNISALQLRQPDFVEGVLAALDRTGANPKRLRLELTESMLVGNLEEVIAKMTQLRSHGLLFALDDFGKGYS